MADKDTLTNMVPESTVKLLFDTVQENNKNNTEAIKDLTKAVNELTKLLSTSPPNSDIIREVQSHDRNFSDKIGLTQTNISSAIISHEEKCNTRKNEQINKAEALDSVISTKIEDTSRNIVTKLDESSKELSGKITKNTDELVSLAHKIDISTKIVGIIFGVVSFVTALFKFNIIGPAGPK
jgi:hypothetical protein